jgi:hypothetical protein
MILLSMTFAALTRPVKAQSTTITLYPAVITDIYPGDTFTANVTVDIGTNQLFMWVLSLSWDPQILNLTGNPIEGPFVKDQVGSTVFTNEGINYTGGYVLGLTCGPLSGQTATGSGMIASFRFTALAQGPSALHLYGPEPNPKPIWLDIDGNELQFDTVTDGSVVVVPEFPAFLILPLFMMITLVAVLITKTRRSRTQSHLSVQ